MNRRKLMSCGVSAVAAWSVPIVSGVALPAHAQTSLVSRCYDPELHHRIEFTDSPVPVPGIDPYRWINYECVGGVIRYTFEPKNYLLVTYVIDAITPTNPNHTLVYPTSFPHIIPDLDSSSATPVIFIIEESVPDCTGPPTLSPGAIQITSRGCVGVRSYALPIAGI